MPSQAAEVAKEATSQAQSGSQVVGSAGEQGRGFAVVADEVRKLASLSADSTEEIQVATATEEQSSVVGEINRNVEEINQFTGETVRSLNN